MTTADDATLGTAADRLGSTDADVPPEGRVAAAVGDGPTGETPDTRDAPAGAREEQSLVALLGGRAGALDASLPAAGFAAGWLLGGRELTWAIVGAVVVAVAVAIRRLVGRRQPRAALLGLTGVVLGALVAARTGRPEDFFLLQLLSNVASALAWIASIWLRRPFLGLIVAALLRQGKAWRQDTVLLHGYQRASWWWVGSYTLRTVVFGTLWLSGAVVALSIARIALSWPLIVAILAGSWFTLRRYLGRRGHPGIRHPQPVETRAQPADAAG